MTQDEAKPDSELLRIYIKVQQGKLNESDLIPIGQMIGTLDGNFEDSFEEHGFVLANGRSSAPYPEFRKLTGLEKIPDFTAPITEEILKWRAQK